MENAYCDPMILLILLVALVTLTVLPRRKELRKRNFV
jgi:hypothetical protein